MLFQTIKGRVNGFEYYGSNEESNSMVSFIYSGRAHF